jgi:uncharacterized protein with von Willebrand factor type A (vWA) domain
MDRHLLSFVKGLRRNGIPASLTETLDAFGALEHIAVEDRAVFRDTLRTTLVKDQTQHPEFERLFQLYFSHLEQGADPDSEEALSLTDRIAPMPESEQHMGEMGSGASILTQSVFRGDATTLEHLAMEAGEAVGLDAVRYPLQVGLFTHRMMERFDWAAVDVDMQAVLRNLSESGIPQEMIARMAARFKHNKEAFKRLLRRLVERELRKYAQPESQRLLLESLKGKSFASLTDREIRQMQEVIALLVQKLRTKVALLERRRRLGRLDVRHTLRKNLQYGGVPVELVFKKKKRKKTEVMALCDVSSSVWTASRFMLNLLYAIQDQFSHVRSFVFVSDLGEVTSFFERYETNEAIKKALKEAGINYFSYTDYGDVLLRFHEAYLGDVNSRSVIIIIGDGRNNHLPSQAWVLDRVKERAKQVIWLNPEHRSTWNLGDSVMIEYEKYCTLVRECRNLHQLSEFIDELVV